MDKRVYFASDLHLGAPDRQQSLDRERRFVRWLREIAPTALEIHLMGDVFDFWMEYRLAVPKGFVRLLGALAEVADTGVPITVYSGNHDFWYADYLPTELGVSVTTEPILRQWFGKTCYLAHGDGLGPREAGFRRMKWLLTRPVLAGFYKQLPSRWAIGLAHGLSAASRRKSRSNGEADLGDREHLWEFSQSYSRLQPEVNYLIFGHRHLFMRRTLPGGAEVIWLGDWLTYDSYAELHPDGSLRLVRHLESSQSS